MGADETAFFALVVFLFATYGLANAIAVLKIGRYFLGTFNERKGLGKIPYLGDLFYCPPCLAFWIGMGISIFALSPSAYIMKNRIEGTVLDGLMASGAIWILHLVAERLGHKLDI